MIPLYSLVSISTHTHIHQQAISPGEDDDDDDDEEEEEDDDDDE